MDEIEAMREEEIFAGGDVEGLKKGVRLMVPLSMGQMLDRAFRLYRQNFLLFVGVIAPLQVIMALAIMLQAAGGPAFAAMAALLGTLLNAVISIVVSALLLMVASRTYFGEQLTIRETYELLSGKLFDLILVVIASVVVGIVLTLWWMLGIMVGWISGLGMIVFFASCMAPLLIPIVLLEETDAFKALRRAWDLTRRRFWRVFGYTLLLNIMAQLLVTGPLLLAIGGGQAVFGLDSSAPIIIQALATLVIGILFTPFSVCAYLMLYFDLRVRTEGLDIELQAAAQSGTYGTPLKVVGNAPAAEQGNWITWSEFGYFVVLSIGMVAIFVGLTALIGFAAIGAAAQFGF